MWSRVGRMKREPIEQLPELVTKDALCARLGVSPDFVERLDLPRYRFSRRAVRYDVKDVQRVLERYRIAGGTGSTARN
ncbi:hypothetical protein [Ruficoccus sp. ZRK36]|uniref:hypothetical protein n=1 Tax=Ruficoccus sp. ZRK36 TaxID=2866311 RepID=UPI001C72AE02|nr:hypothetical protein [Ruficoccus sp. ZRK36]QYY36864.1 hypothetical protein K0V07_05150 [Ruficoccus sp. ZRK36]